MKRHRRPGRQRFELLLAIVMASSLAAPLWAQETLDSDRATPLTVADLFRKRSQAAPAREVSTEVSLPPPRPAPRPRPRPQKPTPRPIATLGEAIDRKYARPSSPPRSSPEPTFKTRVWNPLVEKAASAATPKPIAVPATQVSVTAVDSSPPAPVEAQSPPTPGSPTPLTVGDLFRKPGNSAQTRQVSTEVPLLPPRLPAPRVRPADSMHRQIANFGRSMGLDTSRSSRPIRSEPTFKTPLWNLLASEPGVVAPQGRGVPARQVSATTFRSQGYIRSEGGYFRLAQDVAPVQPLPQTPTAPSAIEQPNQPLPGLTMFGFGSAASNIAALAPERQETLAPIAAVANATNEQALRVSAQPDLAEAVSKDVLAVQTEWRSAVSENPYIRGYKNRQVYSQLDGQYFEPVRWDLDTVVNKVDPGIVQDVIVVEGPYSVQYGPGFTFFDIVTRPTPRNQRTEYRTSTSYIQNGQQFYGRETISGGSQDFGYRFSYGHRNANNYEAGNGVHVPSHYNIGDVLAEMGYNLSNSQRIEGSYRRLDQNHTAYPGQFFDVTGLETNAFNLRYIDEDVTMPWTRLITQGWYNKNNLTGNTFDITKQGVVQTIESALSNFYTASPRPPGLGDFNGPVSANFAGGVVGDITSTGGRMTVQFGELDELSILTGFDTRVIDQRISEYYTLEPVYTMVSATSASALGVPDQFSTGMPRARSINPGAFAEMTIPWTAYLHTKIGGRGDFVQTSANPATLPPGTGTLPSTGLVQNNGLYSFYMVNQLEVTEHWTAGLSFGQAQRPPSLIDRYADGMFMGILQSGYRRVIGNPNLAPERNWQMDASINGKYERWRGFLRGYDSWVINYITYSANSARDPTGAVLLNTLNTPLAELRGFEAFNSYDLAPRVTPFASAHYVYGVDQTLGQPLPQIPPLQGFAGLRFHDPNGGGKWGLETFATITREQDRNAFIRVTGLPNAAPVPIEMRTPGWTTYNMRGYWNVNSKLTISGGINNIFNKTYIQHLSLRTPPVYVFSPGFSPYLSADWVY